MGGQRVALRRESLDRGAARRDLMTPLVSFRNVSCRLGGKDVLRGLSLDVEAGETLVLLGRSGSGKTTALKMVNALLLPSAGEVRVEGTPTVAWDAIRLRRRIGYVIQEAGLFPHFTVEQNVGLVPRLEGWPAETIRARALALLEQVGLPPAQFAARYPRPCRRAAARRPCWPRQWPSRRRDSWPSSRGAGWPSSPWRRRPGSGSCGARHCRGGCSRSPP